MKRFRKRGDHISIYKTMMMKLSFWIMLTLTLIIDKIHAMCTDFAQVSGCFEGGHDFLGDNKKTAIPSLTVDKCIIQCNPRNDSYILLQNGNECYCSVSMPPSKEADKCNTPCHGDGSQQCGGEWVTSVYKVTCRTTTSSTTTTPRTTEITISTTKTIQTTSQYETTSNTTDGVTSALEPTTPTIKPLINTSDGVTMNETEPGKMTAIVIGASVGAIVLIIGLGILIVFLKRKKSS